MRSIRKAKGRRARLRAPSGARPEGPCGVRTRQTVPFPAPSHTRFAAQSLPLSASAWRPCLPRRRRRRLRRLDLVGLDRLELSTSPLSGVRSNHLSYRPKQFLPKAKLHLPHSLPGSSTTDAKHPQGQGPSEPLRGPVRRIAAKPRSSVRTRQTGCEASARPRAVRAFARPRPEDSGEAALIREDISSAKKEKRGRQIARLPFDHVSLPS